MSAFRTRNTADIDTQQTGEETHGQKEHRGHAKQVNGPVHLLVHAPVFRLQHQPHALADHLQLFQVAHQPVIQLIPLNAVAETVVHQLREYFSLRRQEASQPGSPAASLQHLAMVWHEAGITVEAIFLTIQQVGQAIDQALYLLGQVIGQLLHQFATVARTVPLLEQGDQLFGGPQGTLAQGDDPAAAGKNTHRNHILGFSARIQVDATQEQQKLLIRQAKQARPGVFLQQQVAAELAEATVLAEPQTGLRVSAIPVQPQAFLLSQLQLIELLQLAAARATQAVQNEGM